MPLKLKDIKLKDKCHFICSTDDKGSIIVENHKICNGPFEKLLGVIFDSKLTFNAHINMAFSKKQALN